MFDLLIREVAAKFGLGDKAGWILSTLLGFMFQKQTGGLSGFLDLFKQKGLASLASSWLGGSGLPQAINSTQLENVIGGSLIKEIASKTGLASGPIGGALAFILPKIIRGLTPDGTIPTGIPSSIIQYLTGATEKAETPSPAPQPAPTPMPMAAELKGFPWWWLLVPLILLLGWCAMRKPAEAPAPAAEPAKPAAGAPAPATVAQSNPKLVLNNDGGKIIYSGTVADDAAKTSLLNALKAAFGDAASGAVDVDKAAKGANWLAMLGRFLPELKAMSGSKLTLDGDDITLDGSLPKGDIDGLMDKLKSIFGDNFNIQSIAQALVAAAPATPEAAKDDAAKNADAATRMDALKAAGNNSAEDLVKALNLAVIHFATGSANISPDSMGILKKAAQTLKAAAPGTKIEIGGHTDNAGKPESNMKLADARAKSVMAALGKLGVSTCMLTAKGYGDTKPVDPNDTPEGKAKNRRTEFSLAQ